MVKCVNNKVKKQLCKRMVSKGYTNEKISDILKVHRNTISNWKNNKNSNNKKKKGRPSKLTTQDKVLIKKQLYQNYNGSLRKTAKIINSQESNKLNKKTIVFSTVQNYIKKTNWGKKAFKRPVKPLLSRKNINDRVAFGKFLKDAGYLEYTERSKRLRSKIIFSDETYINLRGVYNAQNNRYRTENISDVPPFSKPKFDFKIMVAGAFCANKKSELVFFENGETIDTTIYTQTILPNYISMMNSENYCNKRNIVFQQDGAPAHTSKVSINFLEKNFGTIWGKGIWPGNSPDLSPIENLWSILKDKIEIYPFPKSSSELIIRIKNAWNLIKPEVLENLSESFVDRVLEMEKKNGGVTKY